MAYPVCYPTCICGKCSKMDDFEELPLTPWEDTGPEDNSDDHFNASPYSRPVYNTRRVIVDYPGSIELKKLAPGETFVFPNAVKLDNIYMVIHSLDLDDSRVYYVLLNTGVVYSSNPNKRVLQQDVRVSIDPARSRGRV